MASPARGRLAMSDRTTVYMVFVPTNFWVDSTGKFPNNSGNSWWGNLPPALQTAVTNLADRQLSGYNFLAYGAMGDQPGRHAWHYLDRWQGLPDGTFIAWGKFTNSAVGPLTVPSYWITDPVNGNSYPIWPFHVTNNIPFPTEQGTNYPPLVTPAGGQVVLPYLAFNYLGQLTFDGQTLADRDEYIPLAHGSVMALTDPVSKALVLTNRAVRVQLAGRGGTAARQQRQRLAYSIVHIDRLTGRAVLEFHKMTQ